MCNQNVTRVSDKKAFFTAQVQVETYDEDALARRVIIVDSSGNVVGSSGDYTQAIAYVTGTNRQEYIGLATPGTAKGSTSWQIKKLIYSGNTITDIQWADGTSAFTKEWDERTSYSYS